MSAEIPVFRPTGERPRSREEVRILAAEKARVLLEQHVLKEESFLFVDEDGHSNKETIERHLAEVARLEGLFAEQLAHGQEVVPGSHPEEVKQYGDILEAVIFDQIRRNEWFGPDVHVKKTSKYDDYKRGVDIVVEFEHEMKKPLALAIDVTFGRKGMEAKINKILDEIDKDEPAYINYYRTEDGNFEGKLNNLARVVIGVELHAVQDMAASWVEGDDTALKEHYAQTLILSEVFSQLQAYAEYANRKGKSRAEKAYRAEIAKVRSILDEKPDEHMDHDDRVCSSIETVVKQAIRSRRS